MKSLLLVASLVLSLCAHAQTPQSRFTPDFKIKPDDYTMLTAADGKNPDGLKSWIDDHRRLQVKNWPLGGQTTWEVEVVEPGDYAVNVLFNHSVPGDLTVTVSAGKARTSSVSKAVLEYDWRRFSMTETLRLAKGKQTLTLSIAAPADTNGGKIELLSIELVKSDVKERLHRSALALRAQADTDWFRKAGFGLMFHWTSQTMPRTGPRKPYAEAVRDFDVKTLADQVARTGAGFVTLTTSHAEMYFPAPLSSLDGILPGRTAQRDLVGDLAEVLGQRGIRLILYHHPGSNSDPAWQHASGFWETDTSKFWNTWTAIIKEVGERYRENLAGWWFDDGTANYYYRSAPWEHLANTAKAGNPKRLICFNPWILPAATEFQDYLAGEDFANPDVRGWLKPGDHGRISGGLYEGLQASAALVMESNWLHDKADTEIAKPKTTPEQLATQLRRFRALENVPMLNCEIYQEGTLSPTTVEVIRQANEASRKGGK